MILNKKNLARRIYSMKKLYIVTFGFLFLASLRAEQPGEQQQEESVVVAAVSDESLVQSVSPETLLDPHQAEWKKVKRAAKDKDLCGLLFAVACYVKGELEKQKKQTVILFARQEASEKKQLADNERHDKMYKSLQQSFFENNRFAGG